MRKGSHGNSYDPSEYLRDYCALAMHREMWDEDLMLKSSKDYSKIVTQISLKDQQDLVELARTIPWPDVKNTGRINFMKPGQKSCKSFELCIRSVRYNRYIASDGICPNWSRPIAEEGFVAGKDEEEECRITYPVDGIY